MLKMYGATAGTRLDAGCGAIGQAYLSGPEDLRGLEMIGDDGRPSLRPERSGRETGWA